MEDKKQYGSLEEFVDLLPYMKVVYYNFTNKRVKKSDISDLWFYYREFAKIWETKPQYKENWNKKTFLAKKIKDNLILEYRKNKEKLEFDIMVCGMGQDIFSEEKIVNIEKAIINKVYLEELLNILKQKRKGNLLVKLIKQRFYDDLPYRIICKMSKTNKRETNMILRVSKGLSYLREIAHERD